MNYGGRNPSCCVVGLCFALTGPLLLSAPAPSSMELGAARGGRQLPDEPPGFETNIGRADRSVMFWTHLDGRVFKLQRDGGFAASEGRGASEPAAASMKLLGANRTPRADGLEPLRRQTHYFLGNDPEAWRTNVPHFRRVRYHEVYPGIDLDYYYRDGELEYDFIVAPGADPATIRLAFEGFDEISIDRRGNLVLRNETGEFRHHVPFVYQEIGPTKQEVSGRYRLSRGNSVSFTLAKYDPALPLVIDPRISMSTFIGGRSQDFAAAASVGPDGSVWVAGATQSTNFPMPPEQTRPSLPGLRATFLNRYDQQIDPDGRSSRVLSETIFLGGTAGTLPDSIPVALEVDTDGNLYILGETTTTDFPLSDDPHQRNIRGERDLYVTVIAPGGSGGPVALGTGKEQSQAPTLLYSTYIGGSLLEVPTSADLGNCPSPLEGPCFGQLRNNTQYAGVDTRVRRSPSGDSGAGSDRGRGLRTSLPGDPGGQRKGHQPSSVGSRGRWFLFVDDDDLR